MKSQGIVYAQNLVDIRSTTFPGAGIIQDCSHHLLMCIVYYKLPADLGIRNIYLRQRHLIASHSILWDAITYPSLRYLLVAPKSPYEQGFFVRYFPLLTPYFHVFYVLQCPYPSELPHLHLDNI